MSGAPDPPVPGGLGSLSERWAGRAAWGLASAGTGALLAALILDRSATRAAATQVWPAFVLVAGLLLVGLVADDDGLFAAAGARLAGLAPNRAVLFAGATLLVAAVTALLNLDTSVVFLTPVLVHAARSRGEGEGTLLATCLLLSNAGSLMLPGSNLTNLIVLGHLHLSGSEFFGRMALPSAASVLVTASVVAVSAWRRTRMPIGDPAGQVPVASGPATSGPAASGPAASGPAASGPAGPVRVGLGVVSVLAVTVLVLVLRSPALPVLCVGTVAIAVRLVSRREQLGHVLGVLGLPVLAGLFGIATALGALGRAWSGPATLLSHLGSAGSAVAAAVASVLVNNLPAASLLAARIPPHPFALLVGLDIGPNLFVTGSLAWILWWRAARSAGAAPPVGRTVLLGLVSVPLAMAAALGVLAATGNG